MPHHESRRSTGVLSALNAEVVHNVDGDNHATIFFNALAASFDGTYNVQGSIDGTTYFDLMAYPLTQGCVNGTIPKAGQPFVTEVIAATAVQRALCVATGGLQKIRIRLTAWTVGSTTVTINSDTCDALSPYVRDQKAATLMVTATGTASAAVTASLPAVTGMRIYVDRISVVRSATAALTAAAAPVVVTTTNLPGTPALSFGSDAAGIGLDKELVLDFGGAGIAATNTGSNVTVVAPVYTGVIWRINVSYRLGM